MHLIDAVNISLCKSIYFWAKSLHDYFLAATLPCLAICLFYLSISSAFPPCLVSKPAAFILLDKKSSAKETFVIKLVIYFLFICHTK